MGSRVLSLLAIAALTSAWGCGGDDSGGEEGGAGGAAGSASGGAAGASTGGTGGTGTGGTGTGGTGTGGTGTGGTAGSSTGGAAGSSTGGAAGSSTGGAAGASGGTGGATGGTGGATGGTGGATGGTGGAGFWTDTYNPNGNPNPTNGKHNAGQNCLTCHKQGGPGDPWLFGGTVYKADKTTPAPHVQVGVKSGTNLYTAYTASNGNFWVAAGPTVNWATAEIRARNANGEKKMVSAATSGACNSCHTGATVIVEP